MPQRAARCPRTVPEQARAGEARHAAADDQDIEVVTGHSGRPRASRVRRPAKAHGLRAPAAAWRPGVVSNSSSPRPRSGSETAAVEEPDQAIGKGHHVALVRPAPGGIARQQPRPGRDPVAARSAHFLGDEFGQRGDIAQAQVVALAGHRVQPVGRIADDGHPVRRHGIGLDQLQRVAAAHADPLETGPSRKPKSCCSNSRNAAVRQRGHRFGRGGAPRQDEDKPAPPAGSKASGPSGVKRS